MIGLRYAAQPFTNPVTLSPDSETIGGSFYYYTYEVTVVLRRITTVVYMYMMHIVQVLTLCIFSPETPFAHSPFAK